MNYTQNKHQKHRLVNMNYTQNKQQKHRLVNMIFLQSVALKTSEKRLCSISKLRITIMLQKSLKTLFKREKLLTQFSLLREDFKVIC